MPAHVALALSRRYIRRYLALSVAAFLAVVGGASCAVGAQYGLKLLVGRMAVSQPHAALLPLTLSVDLFDVVSRQGPRFFAQQTSGAVAARIAAAAKASSAVLSTLIWNIVPPCADLFGTVVVLVTIDWRLAAALLAAVATLIAFPRRRGARLSVHRAMARS
jgi:ATP-binding cassette, subfamily B, bacterial